MLITTDRSSYNQSHSSNIAWMDTILKKVSFSPQIHGRWLKLKISFIEFVAPSEFTTETGRLIRILSEYPSGVSKEELLLAMYKDYGQKSTQKQTSLRFSLEKCIQRSRCVLENYEMNIHYSKEIKKYFLTEKNNY